MRELLLPAVAGAFLFGASVALAATDTGIVKNVNPKGDAITLDDGKVFVLAEGTEAESLKVGDKVTVTFKMKAGKMLATKVRLVK